MKKSLLQRNLELWIELSVQKDHLSSISNVRESDEANSKVSSKIHISISCIHSSANHLPVNFYTKEVIQISFNPQFDPPLMLQYRRKIVLIYGLAHVMHDVRQYHSLEVRNHRALDLISWPFLADQFLRIFAMPD